MPKIDLTEEQMKNLAVFLQRVQLTGAEVPAYLEIVQAINKPVLEMTNKNDKITTDK
jgi:hypothetical protein